jgi:fermentation-respiration switch protein FrsA (DUF1100 family)
VILENGTVGYGFLKGHINEADYMQRVLAWFGGITLTAAGLAAILIIGARAYMPTYLAQMMFVTHSHAKETPKDFDVPFVQVAIPSGGRNLAAWQVSAGPDTPAVLIFHGNSETIHNWARGQAYLYRQGLSSMVFDYSGFGGSTGEATIEHLDQDALAAYNAFVRWAGPSRPKFVFGHSLGTAVLLHNARGFAPAPMAAVTYGTFSSAHDQVMYLPGTPWIFDYLIPDFWNNVSDAGRLYARVPLLVVAGANDTNVPPEMGRRVAVSAGGDFKLILDANHDDINDGADLGHPWAPIFDFMQQRMKANHWTGPGIKPQQTSVPAIAK